MWRDSNSGNFPDPDLRRKIEYDDGTDNFQVGANHGTSFPADEWVDLEIPLNQLVNAQSSPDQSVKQIILVSEQFYEGPLSGATMWLPDNLSFSQKVSAEVPLRQRLRRLMMRRT